MSKAFKGDDESDAPIVIPPRAFLPPGTPNYVTPAGLSALRREQAALVAERVRLERADDDADRRRALAIVAIKIAQLDERLSTAEPIVPEDRLRGTVRFGATVVVRSDGAAERTVRIVGVDEADAAQGRIAFVAPLARALLGKRVGETAVVRSPRGAEDVEIVAIAYE